MTRSYWTDIATARLSRRRALAATAGAAAGAALLAACGSSGSGGGSSEGSGGKSSLVSQPVDTTKTAKRGGTLKDRLAAEPNTLDIGGAVAPLNNIAKQAYSTLVREKPGYLSPSQDEIVGDLAESWEFSPDGLQLTFKIRPNLKFHNKAPVNGRTLDIDDIMFSWNRFAAKSPVRGAAVNSPTSPNAPIISAAATDARTFVLKLKEPVVYTLGLFASYGSFSGQVIVIPKEADSGFNLANEMIGTGPFVMTNYTPSVGFTLNRNPDYWDKDWALVDKVEQPILLDQSQANAQFKAGNIHYLTTIRPEEILSVKREEPRLSIYPSDLTVPTTVLTFGLTGKSPFLDERVRQAVSMGLDRDLWIDSFYNVSKFASDGLDVQTRWNTSLAAKWDGWWLDPQGKDFGPNAKYFKHDPAEAKKLLSAAGYASGLNVTSHHIITNDVANLSRYAQVADGMVDEVGIHTTVHPLDYATEYMRDYRDASGQYEGWNYHTISGAVLIGPVHSLAAEYWSKSAITFHGFTTGQTNDKAGDPQVDSLIEKARTEQDTEKRRALIFDIQKYLAGKMYALPMPGGASGFNMAWPALGNYSVFRGPAAWAYYGLWVDDTKPPFKSA